jgi:phosphoribosylglycinamide formyltransferase 1
MPQNPIKLAVLASGGGTTLQNLLDLIDAGRLDARVTCLIASRPGIKAIERAQRHHVPAHVVDRKQFDSASTFSKLVLEHVDAANADLICLAGWLSMLDIPERYRGKVINIHPSLLPSFGGHGMFGQRVHAAVLAHGCKVSGCTVHFVDEHYDNGPILVQRCCPVLESDTSEELAHRVFEEEKIAYPDAIRLIQAGRVKLDGRRVRIE